MGAVAGYGSTVAILADAERQRTELFVHGEPFFANDAVQLPVPALEGLEFDMADFWRGLRRQRRTRCAIIKRETAMNLVLPEPMTMVSSRVTIQARPSDQDLMICSRSNPGLRVEWHSSEGQLVMSPSGFYSSRASGRIFRQLDDWANRRGDGYAADSSAGFRLRDGSVLSPDASWVSSDRFASAPQESRGGFPAVCPELVVEVKSPNDSVAELRRKCVRWLEYGAEAAVLIDPEARRAELLSRDGTQHSATADQLAVSGFEGLVLDLSGVWKPE